jgi:hypothetical protein
MHLINIFHSVPQWAWSLLMKAVNPLFSWTGKTLQKIKINGLEKEVQSFRDTAMKNPSLSAWNARQGSAKHRRLEKLVKAGLMVRSPYFPG